MKIKINDRIVEVGKRDYPLDSVTARHTAFQTFDELCNKTSSNYRPSLYLGGKPAKAQRELLCLTFAYNLHMFECDDSRRVYKADWAPVHEENHPLLNEFVAVCEVPGCKHAPTYLRSIQGRVVNVCSGHKRWDGRSL